MNFLRQSTAVDIAIGPFIDDDGITPATGLSITQAETRLKKNNGAWAQANDNTTATHEEEGWYEKELDATDTNTCGILIVAVYISGNLAFWKEFQVVEEAVYDMLFAASATGIIGTAQTGDSFARLGAPAGASIAADIAAIEAQTDDIGAAGAGLSAVPWNAAWDAEVQSEVADALGVYDPPTHAELVSEVNAAQSDIAGVAALIGTPVADLATDIAAVQTAVGDLPTNSELATALAAADDAVLAAIAALNNLSAAEVNAEVVDALATDTYAEPGQGSPASTTTLATKIGFLYKAWRNRTTQTASEYALYADDGTTKDQEAGITDNGTTMDRAEVQTGA